MRTGQQQIDGFGSGHQDVGRVFEHFLSLGLRCITGAHGDPDVSRMSPLQEQLVLNARQRLLEIALDIITEGLQWRDINDPGLSHQRFLLCFTHHAVNDSVKSSQRFTTTGGGCNQSVLSCLNGRPRIGLRRRRLAQSAGKPGTAGRMKV